MNLEEQCSATETLLSSEAGSLGELLELLRDRVSPALIGDPEWMRLQECARELPATIAAFPFGFELPLHERRPHADLGVSVVGGTVSATFFEKEGASKDAGSSAAGIAGLLRATEPGDSPLRQVVGRKMMLEYDIEATLGGGRADPGLFLRPAERPILGDGADQRLRDIGCVLDAIVTAAGWRPDAAEHRQVERVYRAQTPGTRIDSFGAFPSRERAIRLAVSGFRTSCEIVAFLERAGWPGQRATAASAVSRLEERGAFVGAGVHFDVHADGLGPTLGLSFLAKKREANDPRYWVDSPDQWTSFLNCLRAEGHGLGEKIAALAQWSSGAEPLFCRSGAFILMRGIHHIKLVLKGDRVEQAKGYVFFLVCSWPQGGGATR